MKNLLKILAIDFTPARRFLNRSGPWLKSEDATGKQHDLPQAHSRCSLEAQRSQSKKNQNFGHDQSCAAISAPLRESGFSFVSHTPHLTCH
jgi:hypothetical protein